MFGWMDWWTENKLYWLMNISHCFCGTLFEVLQFQMHFTLLCWCRTHSNGTRDSLSPLNLLPSHVRLPMTPLSQHQTYCHHMLNWRWHIFLSTKPIAITCQTADDTSFSAPNLLPWHVKLPMTPLSHHQTYCHHMSNCRWHLFPTTKPIAMTC